MWQHGGVSLSLQGVAAGVGLGGGQEDALGVIFFGINETHYPQCLLLCLVSWLRDYIWMIVTLTLTRCFSSLFFSLYTYTYTYTYCYCYCILYFLVLTKPAPAWVPFEASFSASDTIATLYRHRSTNRFVSLDKPTTCQVPLVHPKLKCIQICVRICIYAHMYICSDTNRFVDRCL